jgi:hypothetical protein
LPRPMTRFSDMAAIALKYFIVDANSWCRTRTYTPEN